MHVIPPANLVADLKANSLTLDHLYKKKVLHKPQWDLLYSEQHYFTEAC